MPRNCGDSSSAIPLLVGTCGVAPSTNLIRLAGDNGTTAFRTDNGVCVLVEPLPILALRRAINSDAPRWASGEGRNEMSAAGVVLAARKSMISRQAELTAATLVLFYGTALMMYSSNASPTTRMHSRRASSMLIRGMWAACADVSANTSSTGIAPLTAATFAPSRSTHP
jgi:hypothetical protein